MELDAEVADSPVSVGEDESTVDESARADDGRNIELLLEEAGKLLDDGSSTDEGTV